jgi:hypothetical protein
MSKEREYMKGVMAELSKPLGIEDIEFRVQSINYKGEATILGYKDARVDMKHLDEATNGMWMRKHTRDNANCGVGIYDYDTEQWVWKEDTGTASMTEAAKGMASDSFKRACFNWGIGRELYDLPIINVALIVGDECKKEGTRFKQTWGLKLREWKWTAEYTDGKITMLAARDDKQRARYYWTAEKGVIKNKI